MLLSGGVVGDSDVTSPPHDLQPYGPAGRRISGRDVRILLLSAERASPALFVTRNTASFELPMKYGLVRSHQLA